MGYGAPHEADGPRTCPVSPSRSPRFSPPPREVIASVRFAGTPHGYPCPFLPAATGPGHGPRGSRVRAWYLRLAAFATPRRLFCPFPLRGSKAQGTPGTAGLHGLQAGRSEQRGSFTLPVTGLAIVRPRLVSGQQGLQSPSAPWRLTTPSAPACSARVIGIWVLPIPRPGLAPGFPRPALGVRPQDPFRVAQPSYFPFHGVGVRSKEGFPSSAAFGAAPARISPGTRLTRLSPSGWRPLGYSSGPGTTGLELRTTLRGEGSPGQGPGP